MQAILEIESGPSAGEKRKLQPGQVLRVGHGRGVDLVVPGDSLMSSAHFAVNWDGETCHLSDLNSLFGTFLNGDSVSEANVRDGARIIAGESGFRIHLAPNGAPAAAPGPALPASPVLAASAAALAGHLLQVLRAEPLPLFALLDAARDAGVLKLLRWSRAEHQSLYEGPDGELLADFAPYLVALPPGCPLLEPLARDGWGESWGVYLTSDRPFAEVRRHFRRFLMVREESGKEMYFRFYDPRVLRLFLPTCKPEQLSAFYGPIHCFLVEAEGPQSLLRFTAERQRAWKETVPLGPGVH